MRDRLIELMKKAKYPLFDGGPVVASLGLTKMSLGYIADYLLENGVIVPPCKLNQTLWRINFSGEIEPCRVSSLTQKADGSFKVRVKPLYVGVYEIKTNEIGRTHFLTCEEAERALKGGAE